MKNMIIFLSLLIVAGLGIMLGIFYWQDCQIQNRENYAHQFMQNQFADFSQKWEVAQVPMLFIENAEVNNIAKMLVDVKEHLGSCTLKETAYCESQERYKQERPDAYFSENGYSVRCPFVMSCEKEAQVRGEAIFFPDGNIAKLYSFSLTFDD